MGKVMCYLDGAVINDCQKLSDVGLGPLLHGKVAENDLDQMRYRNWWV